MRDIPEITPALLRRMPLPNLDAGDKEQRGRVMVVAGSAELPGAAVLTGTAALRAGAGKLQIATCGSVAPYVGIIVPEARVFALPETEAGAISPGAASIVLPRATACDAVVIGPGMADEPAASSLTAEFLKALCGPNIVLDAAAMADLRRDPQLLHRHSGRIVITPHFGEMAGMLGIKKADVEADPVAVVQHAAALLDVVVALKGSSTWVATPDQEVWIFRNGCIGLATSGSGDVLAGIIGGLLARGCNPVQATTWGIHLHAGAGHRLTETKGPVGFLARELLDEIPRLMAALA